MRYIIDDSKTADTGTIIVYKPLTDKKVKCLTDKEKEYQYILQEGPNVLPLQMGNGIYTIRIYEHLTFNQYDLADNRSFDVRIKNPLSVYLNPNVFVNYAATGLTVTKARELCRGLDTKGKIAAVCKFVKGHLCYRNGFRPEAIYFPSIDRVYVNKTGICLDYAAMTAAMLRSQGIPCKVVFGHTGSVYHAWNEVFTDKWERIDLTYSDNGIPDSYITNGNNYIPEFYY